MSTPASDLLRADHRRLETHLDHLLDYLQHLTEARLPEVRHCFHEIRRLVSPHLHKEENIFYPRLRQSMPELLERMDEQHEYMRELERFLDELLSATEPLEAQRMGELRRFGVEFHDSIQHHIVEEEDYLLRIADRELTPAEQQALFAQMEKVV